MMKFLIIYMLVSAILLVILVATGLCEFEWVPGEATFKTELKNILLIICVLLIWPIATLIFIIAGKKKGRK